MYQVLFKIESEWYHLDGMFKTLDKAVEEAYILKNGCSTARLIDGVEIVKMVVENGCIVSRELIKTL